MGCVEGKARRPDGRPGEAGSTVRGCDGTLPEASEQGNSPVGAKHRLKSGALDAYFSACESARRPGVGQLAEDIRHKCT